MSENKQSALQSIEQKALRIYELNRQQALAEEEKTLLKRSLVDLMKENNMHEHLLRLDNTYDLKITVGGRTTKKLDKEELASDLGISVEAAGKKDVLIKKVEEGKLTFARYKEYEYEETKEQLTVRRVNA